MQLKKSRIRRGRPPKRCSIYRIATLISPVGNQTTQGMFSKAVNHSNHRVAGNTHLKKCIRPTFIQSDRMYEDLIDTLNESPNKTGWQQTNFQPDHSLDRFDCLVFGLDSAIQEYAFKRSNDSYFDPYESLAIQLGWTQNGLFTVVKSQRAAPRKALEFLRNEIASQIGNSPDKYKIEQLDPLVREYPPIHEGDRQEVIKLLVK